MIAHEDPGTPNWIATEGRVLGTASWRFQVPEGEIEPLAAKLVPLAEAAST